MKRGCLPQLRKALVCSGCRCRCLLPAAVAVTTQNRVIRSYCGRASVHAIMPCELCTWPVCAPSSPPHSYAQSSA